MTLKNMAAESGGLVSKRRDTCLQFSCKPTNVVYLPSLSCLIATSSNGTLEVLDIHSGSTLRKVNFAQEEVLDQNGMQMEGLLCSVIEDGEKLFVTKGNVIGCRGILGEKILLDSILQYDCKKKSTWKVELDLVQAGILLNGLQSCQRLASSPKQFGAPSPKSEEDLKAVTDELQKQYEKALLGVKDFTKKSVKWMTVCLEMEKQLLGDAFAWVYTVMSRQIQDPSLPIIGDVVRRISLCSPPKKKNDFGKIERLIMLGEAERLDTFKTWPHKDYEYALPSPMAEAGFYHPAYSTATEDRAICFKCDICLVYWEPSDQPWSEHERHSSSCPFVKGEFTGNVPLSVCAAVCQAQSLKHQDDKVICIGNQTCDGLVVVGTSKGTVYLLEAVPLFKVKAKLKKFFNKKLSEENGQILTGKNDDTEELKCSSSSSSFSYEPDELEENSNRVEIVVDTQGSGQDAVRAAGTESSETETQLFEINGSNECKSNSVDDSGGTIRNAKKGACKKAKRDRYDVEIQALTLSKHQIFGENGSKRSLNCIVIGRICTFDLKEGEEGERFQTLSVAILDERSMKIIESKKSDEKFAKVGTNVTPPFPNLVDDPLFHNDFESYVPSDSGELSVINEYLRASKQKNEDKKSSKSKKKDSKRKEIKCHEFKLPRYINARSHRISHLFATKTSLFVVVNCKEMVSKDAARLEEQEEECSSIDSDTEVIEMPNGDIHLSQTSKRLESYIFEYRWILRGETVIVHEPHVSSRSFSGKDYLHDVILISNKHLGFKEQRYDVIGEKICIDSTGSELLLAATGMEQKQISVISTIDLNTLNVVLLESVPQSSIIDHIVYCKGISVIACCLNDGKVVLCHLEGQPKKSTEEPKKAPVPHAAQSLEGSITEDKLSQLLNLTKFEAISSGVHVFLPMDWVVGTTSLSANAPLQSKKRLFPHVRDIYPITSPSLPKSANGLPDSKLKDKRLRSKDHSVSFKIFVSSETSIGYLDLSVECSSSVSKDSDIIVSLFLIESNQNFLDESEDFRQRERICGPVLLSECCSNSGKKTSLMLTSPKLTSVKSSYLALDLEYRSRDSASPENEQLESGRKDAEEKSNEVAIADFVTNVQIVVYQYIPVMSETHLPTSCRLYLLENSEISRRLLKQFLDASYNRTCLGEDSEARKCLEVIVWIWTMMAYSEDIVRHNFVTLVEEDLTDLIKVSFLKGDRTLAHRFYQLITGMYSYSRKRGHTSFHKQLMSALNVLMENVQQFFSVGALRWFFRLCNVAVLGSSQSDVEILLSSMLGPLADMLKMQRHTLTDEQMLLQTRFDLAGSPLEPVIAEPVDIDLVIGENVKQKVASNDRDASQSTRKENTISIPASAVPGILEVDQLGFTCLMTSEGSKCEKLATSNDCQSSSLKVSLKSAHAQSEEAKSQYQSMQEMPLDYDDDLPFLDPQSLYDNIDPLEPEASKSDFEGFDYSVYEVLEEENFDLWTPGASHGGMDRRTKVVKKKGKSLKQNKAHDIDNEFITPETMLLVVERMHSAAQHFAVIDFQRPISLTDVLIPPCESLSSISIYAWKERQTEKEAFHVVTSNEIGEKALVLTDVIPSIKCQYLKIIANGCRKLNSTKISIALGNFYGRPLDGTYELSQLKFRLQQQYDRVYCRYALACDRLIQHIQDITKSQDRFNETEAGDVEDKLMKAYTDCTKAQLSLNHVFHSLKFYECQSNEAGNSLLAKDRGPLSLDFMRVLTDCLTDTLLLTLRSYAEYKDTPENFDLQNIDLSIDHFLELFKNLCILGSAKIRQHGSMLLQYICETQPWWKEFLIRVFKYCFEEKASHGVPKNRLFALFMKMLKTTADLNSVLLSLVGMLQEVLSPLSETLPGGKKLDFEMADWLLLVLNELLQHLDQGDWLFLTPWSAIARESNSLQMRTQEQIRLYLQEQQKMLSKFHKNLHALATTAKKKYSTMVVKMPEASTSSKELKDLLLLRRHPLFNRRKADKLTNPPWNLLEEENANFDKARTGSIHKKHVLPSVNALLKLVLVSRSENDFERLVLACKVATLILETSNVPVHLAEMVHLDDLVNLMRLPLTTDSVHAPWVNHAVICFIRQTLYKGKPVSSSADVTITEEPNIEIPVNLEIKAESSASSGSSGESSETLSGQEGEPVEEKLTDIASSIATNLMKAIKETVGDKKDVLKEAVKNTGLKISKPDTKQNTYHLVDGFDRGFQMESNKMCYDSYDMISDIMTKGLWRNKVPAEQHHAEATFDRQGSVEDHSMISTLFAELAKKSINSKSLILVIYQWIAVTNTTNDSNCQSLLPPPLEVVQELMLSDDFDTENKYTKYLYEKAMLGVVQRIKSNEADALHVLQSSLDQQPHQNTHALRSLSLLKVFCKSFHTDASSGKTSSEKTKETAPVSSQPNNNCKLYIKRLLLEALKNRRTAGSLKETLHIANNLPVFETLEENEVEITFEIMKSLTRSCCELVEENREMLMLSFTEANTSQKRLYVLDRGRHWQVGKFCGERNESQVRDCVLLLDKLICSIYSNSVSGSRLLELLYSKESKIIQDLLEVLFIAGDPSILPGVKQDFPVSLMPQNEMTTKESEFHPDINNVFQLVFKLANNVMDRHRLLHSILLYFESKDEYSYSISKALRRLLQSLLQTQQDTELFVERGGLSLIVDRINSNAELLKWSSDKKAALSISKALFSQEDAEEPKNKTRTDFDGSELKNLAPCGRIISPSNSPPADILLQSKPAHVRSRFAAWSYHYSDSKSDWLELTVELPFAILLKQVVLYHHQSFLGNCPAEVSIEVKGCGEVFVPYSPNLVTSGLHVVDVYFARGLPAKAVKIHMKRPLDSDVVKLNNIALFGKAALSSTNRDSICEFNKRFYWIDLLNHILEKDGTALDKLEKGKRNAESLTNSLLIFSNLSSSVRPRHQETLIRLMVSMFKKHGSEWNRILGSCILPNDGKSKVANKRPMVQKETGCFLIVTVMRALDAEDKSKCLTLLLQWAQRLLQRQLTFDSEELHSSTVVYFSCIANVVRELNGTDGIDTSLLESVTETLMSLISKMNSKDCHLESYSKLLSSLVAFDTPALNAVIDRCILFLERDEFLRIPAEEQIFFNLMSTMSQNEEIIKSVIQSNLPSTICGHIGRILNALSSVALDNLHSNLSSIDILLKYIYSALSCFDFKEWIGSMENCTFLQPLLEFLSTAYLEKCLLIKPAYGHELILGVIHKLQHITIMLIRRMTSFNRQNQAGFVNVLKTLLSQETRPEFSLVNNSFLKRLVLQLVLQEETVLVELNRANGKRDDTDRTLLDHSYLNLKQIITMHLRLSDRLSSIFREQKISQPFPNEKPKQPSGPSEIGSTTQYEDWSEEADWNDNANMSVLFASANSATAKRQLKPESVSNDNQGSTASYCIEYYHSSVSKDPLPTDLTVGQIINILERNQNPCKNGRLTLHVRVTKMTKENPNNLTQIAMLQSQTYPTLLHVFAADGGIQLLAKHSRISLSGEFGQTVSTSIGFLMKFVSLVGFSDMFLKENQKAEYLLRLMLGEEENSNGEPISSSILAPELPLLPFIALRDLFKSAPLTSECGQSLRKDAFDKDIIKLLLNHLGSLFYQETKKDANRKTKKAEKTDVRPSYWARGTGFGTGSTASTWDVEKVMQEKKKEDEQVICLLLVLSSYIDPFDSTKSNSSDHSDNCLPDGVLNCLEESPLRSVLSNYLRNDSVLDMARHIPLFNALMRILRALSSSSNTIPLLLPKGATSSAFTVIAGQSGSIDQLLSRLNDCADTYINRLKGNKKRKPVETKKATHSLKHSIKHAKKASEQIDQSGDGSPEIASEALTLLIGNIQETSKIVQRQIKCYQQRIKAERDHNIELNPNENGKENGDEHSLEDKYLLEMKECQFGTFEFVADEGDDGKVEFLVPFHFAEILRNAVASGDFSYSSRARRLAQEIASLSTSLPLSFSSSVFLRCDENRLDLMKVLITGPEDTPYANGCFEFDVYFPRDYPSSPMMVNLQTNGQHSVRFNPNLYNDGKVCLSILNTWHGRPEEKWNPQTSNLLQVLVSIQSLILVPEPYFNEPGYERSRGTPTGQQNSMDYNANIKQATIKWAMLEQLRNPAPCFKQIIRRHFSLKKASILKQCEQWISQMKDHSSKKKSTIVHYEAMKRHFASLKVELDKLTKEQLNHDSPPGHSPELPPLPTAESFTEEKEDLVFV